MGMRMLSLNKRVRHPDYSYEETRDSQTHMWATLQGFKQWMQMTIYIFVIQKKRNRNFIIFAIKRHDLA